MTISQQRENDSLILHLTGRLDTNTAPVLEAALESSRDGIKSLTLDMEGLEYLSSAGLRVLLAEQKRMNKQGSMIVKNVCPAIMEVFTLTGFVDVLDIR
jgi:anti-sigma B factor antagonist